MNIIEIIKNDGVGVIATDTVYGIVASLLSPIAVEKMYRVKHGGRVRPVGTVLIASTEQLRGVVDNSYVERAVAHWPGPVSVILPVSGLEYAHKGMGSLPFRIPADDRLVKLLEQTGPLATSSANLPGKPPATTLQQAKDYFGEHVDFYEDGGDLSDRQPSAIVELLPDGTCIVLRK